MKIETELITPEMAEAYLAKNGSNRRVSSLRVASYMKDIQAGRWQFNPSPIVFSQSGMLLDGQHRLIAIVDAGVAVEMLVMTGAPDSCKDTIDSGKSRSAGDALAIRGVLNANSVASIAARIIAFEKSGSKYVMGNAHHTINKTNANATKKEVVEYVVENDEYLQSLHVRGSGLYDATPIRVMSPAEIGFLFHALTPENEANEFLSKIVTGVGLVDKTPELALRRILEKTRVTKELHYANSDINTLIFLAFEKSKNGEACEILRLPKIQK